MKNKSKLNHGEHAHAAKRQHLAATDEHNFSSRASALDNPTNAQAADAITEVRRYCASNTIFQDDNHGRNKRNLALLTNYIANAAPQGDA